MGLWVRVNEETQRVNQVDVVVVGHLDAFDHGRQDVENAITLGDYFSLVQGAAVATRPHDRHDY